MPIEYDRGTRQFIAFFNSRDRLTFMKNSAFTITAPLALAAALLSTPTIASDIPSPFIPGSAIPEFGKFAKIDSDMPIPPDTKFKVSFDSTASEAGKENRTLNAAARFVNMHVDAGVDVADIRLTIVVHGSAVFDMASDIAYARKYDGTTKNPNAAIIAALQKAGVEIVLCGQSAAYHGVAKQEMLPGVKMALSAMTAHALLQQEGYTLNPF